MGNSSDVDDVDERDRPRGMRAKDERFFSRMVHNLIIKSYLQISPVKYTQDFLVFSN